MASNGIIPRQYDPVVKTKPKETLISEKVVNTPQKHIIHIALKWHDMLNTGKAESLTHISRIENLSRARVTQIMNLLKLPAKVKEFLTGLQDPVEIRRYSERGLRHSQTSKEMLKELNHQKV